MSLLCPTWQWEQQELVQSSPPQARGHHHNRIDPAETESNQKHSVTELIAPNNVFTLWFLYCMRIVR